MQLKISLDHAPTHCCLVAERAYLKSMEGGCSIPSFALATLTGEDQISITGGIISLDGKEILTETLTAPIAEAEQLGQELGKLILSQGGDKILEGIRQGKSSI